LKRRKGKEVEKRTGNKIGEKEEKGIFEKEGYRDWKEGRDKGVDTRRGIGIEEKDGKRD
jgi:hypothetical protein